MAIKTINNVAEVCCVGYTTEFSCLCSLANLTPFYGEIQFEYKPDDLLIEFVSFEKWLTDNVYAKVSTVEGVARLVFDALERVLGDIPLKVTIYGRSTVHAPAEAQICHRWEEDCA